MCMHVRIYVSTTNSKFIIYASFCTTTVTQFRNEKMLVIFLSDISSATFVILIISAI